MHTRVPRPTYKAFSLHIIMFQLNLWLDSKGLDVSLNIAEVNLQYFLGFFGTDIEK